ncbi:MAG TPA: hypothetical protein PKM50_06520 [Methanoregula sp.]|nr:hypothetical protein [Methanoregula sp.]
MRSLYHLLILVLFGACALVLPVSGYTTQDSITAAGKVYVSNVTIDPGVLFTGDKTTVTFSVTNGNTVNSTTDQGVMLNHATFGDNDIRLVSGTYDSSSNIGPLQTRAYVFDVVTNSLDGTYYPTFSIDFRDANSLYYRTPVKVDNTPLMMSVISKPDTFTLGKKETIIVQIANSRQNTVKNVVLDVSGNGTTITPSIQYLGSLAANSAINTTFSVTPDSETDLSMTVKYDNGDNHHSISQALPIQFGTDKKQASPKVSNVEVKLTGGMYHVTGDVTNAGLMTANGVIVTALSPAVPEDPYKTYVIGALKPDDFGSFEVTFSAPNTTTQAPVQILFKDSDGNIVKSTQNVTLPHSVAVPAKTGFPVLPVVFVVIVLALFVGGWALYLRRYNQ